MYSTPCTLCGICEVFSVLYWQLSEIIVHNLQNHKNMFNLTLRKCNLDFFDYFYTYEKKLQEQEASFGFQLRGIRVSCKLLMKK